MKKRWIGKPIIINAVIVSAMIFTGGIAVSETGESGEQRMAAEKAEGLQVPSPPFVSVPTPVVSEETRTVSLLAARIAAEKPAMEAGKRWALARIIAEEGAARSIDPWLICAIIKVESDFDVYALGQAGERGLMQILPSTARLAARGTDGDVDLTNPDVLLDPALNVRLSTVFLADLLRQYEGNYEYAVTAYNKGTAEGAPNGYALKVMSQYRRMKQDLDIPAAGLAMAGYNHLP